MSENPPATCVIVSGASRGLGLAVVADLLQRGLKVAGFARSPGAELKELADRYGDAAYIGSADVNDSEAVTRFVAAAADRLGPADGLVSNAGIGQRHLHIDVPAQEITQVIHTDLVAPLLLTRTFLRRLLLAGRSGRIVMVSSIYAQRGYPGGVAYAAAKGGLEAATRALAREMRARALVNCVAPGIFPSAMSAELMDGEQLNAIMRRTASGTMTTCADVTAVIRMLLLEQTNIDGSVITIDGGCNA